MTKECNNMDRKVCDAWATAEGVNVGVSIKQRLAYLQRAEGSIMKVTQKNTVVWCVENAPKSLKLS